MKKSNALLLAAGLCFFDAWLAETTSAADLVLFDFHQKTDAAKIAARDVKVSSTDSGLVMTTGHQQQWPGITLNPPEARWNLANFSQLALALKNTGTNEVNIHCRVDNPGADGSKNCINANLVLQSGASGLLKADLLQSAGDHLGGKLFGMRGYPTGPNAEGGINRSNVTGLVIFVDNPKTDHQFEIQEIRATGTATPPTASVLDASPFFPFIDTFGQYKHRDWPGKVKSVEDLKTRKTSEAADLAAHPCPADWDQYGGWKGGPKLEATGFFRTEKYRGKWWLVDPEGRLFFSQGIDCVRMLDFTPVDERETWFDNFPGNAPDLKAFFGNGWVLYGHYAKRTVKSYSFAEANLFRKYGPQWSEISANLAHQRMRSWGINTIGNWSASSVKEKRRTPYTDSVGTLGGAKMIEGSDGYWGKFPDVFDPSFETAAQKAMQSHKSHSANDPWCIGYFSDNEMSWGNDTSLALATLKSPPEQAIKKVFVADLKARYGEIEKLNAAWNMAHASWDALLQSKEVPSIDKAGEDLRNFYTKTAEQYFSTVRKVIKSVAPHQLYLGCRFAAVNDRAARAAAKYCDVVSYNLYQKSVADFQTAAKDVPLLIGEFHFGALDRGLFHTGLVPTANQQARADAYKNYILGAARHPQFVGAHWFQWQDEPTTGRVYDAENYQIGFVDIADTPYREIVKASREAAAQLYSERLKK